MQRITDRIGLLRKNLLLKSLAAKCTSRASKEDALLKTKSPYYSLFYITNFS